MFKRKKVLGNSTQHLPKLHRKKDTSVQNEKTDEFNDRFGFILWHGLDSKENYENTLKYFIDHG
jgi:hypothetical protein